MSLQLANQIMTAPQEQPARQLRIPPNTLQAIMVVTKHSFLLPVVTHYLTVGTRLLLAAHGGGAIPSNHLILITFSNCLPSLVLLPKHVAFAYKNNYLVSNYESCYDS